MSISDIAYDLGHYDYSYFAAEFKRFSGSTSRERLKQLQVGVNGGWKRI